MLNIELINKVNKNLKNFKSLNNKDYNKIIDLINIEKGYFCFDTESCYDDESKESVRIYSWGLSHTHTDFVVYGETLEEFLQFIKNVTILIQPNKKLNKNQSCITTSINIFVHNLAWDIEFFRYTLPKEGYTYHYDNVDIETKTKKYTRKNNKSFNIVENDGIVYSAQIVIEEQTKYYGFDSELNSVVIPHRVILNFYDSFKIVPNSLDNIAKNILSDYIEEYHNKLSNEYDYELIRNKGHKLSELEKCYLYNDVYLLKEFILHYYIENLLEGKTASSIAFNRLLRFKYENDNRLLNENNKNGKPTLNKLYEIFTLDYPDIKDLHIQEKIIYPSYKGGYTYTSPYIKGKHLKNISGFSLDINSSYPSIMMYEKLPYGKPKYFTGKYEHDSKYDLYFQRIKFDGFKRKGKSKIGFIQIGNNSYIEGNKKDIVLNGEKIRKNEYVHTNIDKSNKFITTGYELVLTGAELDFLLDHYNFYYYKEIDGRKTRRICEGVQYVDGCKFKSNVGYFKEFIEDCTNRKIQGKEENNPVKTVIAKTDMNSVYGKLGSSPYRSIRESYINDKGLASFRSVYTHNEKYDYIEKRKYYRAYASFVTSYGRLKLWNLISHIEKTYKRNDVFLYSDTDSVYLNIPFEDIKKLPIEIDPYKLGAWDIEKEYSQGKFIGAKKYLVYGMKFNYKNRENKDYKFTCKCAGLPEETRNKINNFDDFDIGKNFDKKVKKKIKGGYTIINSSFTISEFDFI